MHANFINEIPPDKFTLIDQIGSGTFSDIFSATHIKTNTNVALKVSLKTNVEEYDKILDQEVKISQSLHHPFICKYFYEFETEHLNVIVMELVDGMTALDYVNQSHGIPLSEVKNIFTQLLIAIEYLHDEAHITHRDLKLENIMIDSCGHIRLIDFGFSTKNSMMSTLCGSIPYCAPELLSGQLYTKESDIWSMGIILYSLFDGNLPFFHSNTNTLVSMICNSDVKFPPNFDESLKDLVLKILDKNPVTRIKIEGIKQHPFISQEKLLLIDYKQLFSPIDASQAKHTNKNSATIKFNSKLGVSSNVRKSGFFRNTSSTYFMLTDAQEIVHERITMRTDDIDVLIENRKDFPHNLTKLIESAFLMSTFAKENEGNISLYNNQMPQTSGHINSGHPLNVNLSTQMAGTSDFVPRSNANHNHHFVLTNHFAGMHSHSKPAAKKARPPVSELIDPSSHSKTDQENVITTGQTQAGQASASHNNADTSFHVPNVIHHSNTSAGRSITIIHHSNSPNDQDSNDEFITGGPASYTECMNYKLGGRFPMNLIRRTKKSTRNSIHSIHHSVSPGCIDVSHVHRMKSPQSHPMNSSTQQTNQEVRYNDLHNGPIHTRSSSNDTSDIQPNSIHLAELSHYSTDSNFLTNGVKRKMLKRKSNNHILPGNPQIISPMINPSTSNFIEK